MNKRLRKWRNAGLIDDETVNRILDYEKANSRPIFLYAASGLAALSILIGFISFVAANWDGIPVPIKLGGDLLIGIGLVMGLYQTDPKKPSWIREALLTLLGGWTIASIAMISQIYQLGGHPKHALTAWCLITLPVFLQGRGRLVASVWLVGYASTAVFWVDILKPLHIFEKELHVYLFLVPTLCWMVIAIARIPKFRNLRPETTQIFSSVSALCLGLYASLAATLPFYEGSKDELTLPVLVTAAVSLPFVIWIRKRLPQDKGGWRHTVVMTYLLLFLPWLLTNPTWKLWGLLEPVHVLLASGSFMLFWGMVARSALINHQKGLFRTATFFIALRMIILYFELVGNLLNTSLVFLIGGVIALAIIIFWHRKNKALLATQIEEAKS